MCRLLICHHLRALTAFCGGLKEEARRGAKGGLVAPRDGVLKCAGCETALLRPRAAEGLIRGWVFVVPGVAEVVLAVPFPVVVAVGGFVVVVEVFGPVAFGGLVVVAEEFGPVVFGG